MEYPDLDDLRDYGYSPTYPDEANAELLRIYGDAIAAQQEGSHLALPHIGQVVLKTVAGCNFACKSENSGLGYECYEYVTDDWMDLPPVMSDEVAWQTGITMGKYAAKNGLQEVEGVIHGGEPLYVPRDASRPQQRARHYYDRILPLIRQAMQEAAPDTTLNYAMQTNGSLLTTENLDMLLEHGVRVGVSLDGPQAMHDLNRVITHNGRRIGTHRLVERGLHKLAQEQYAEIYGGIICVMDLRSDPLDVLASLQRYDPPAVELHLPYGTWEDQPPGLRDNPLRQLPVIEAMEAYRNWTAKMLPHQVTAILKHYYDPLIREASPIAQQLFEIAKEGNDIADALPYADWLLKFYTANKQLEQPLDVRLFTSLERLSLGSSSLTEALGPDTGGEIVVRTDGSIELPDSLRMARSGLEKTEFNVFDHDLEQVADTLRAHNHLGKKSVSEQACDSCDIQYICGGGHIATRFSKERSFDNPSVYCADLEHLIRTIRPRIVEPQAAVVKNLVEERRIKKAREIKDLQWIGRMFMSRDYETENF